MPLPVVAPAVWALVAGTGAEVTYAWYDPDLFTKGIWSNYELDKRVETLNNYWQHLGRIVTGRIDPGSKAAQNFQHYLRGWVSFKQRYDDAIFRRAMDPFGLWGAKADYENELNEIWAKRFSETMTAVIALDPLVQQKLASRGIDIETYMSRSGLNTDGTPKGGNAALYIGVGITVTLIAIGAIIATKANRKVIRV